MFIVGHVFFAHQCFFGFMCTWLNNIWCKWKFKVHFTFIFTVIMVGLHSGVTWHVFADGVFNLIWSVIMHFQAFKWKLDFSIYNMHTQIANEISLWLDDFILILAALNSVLWINKMDGSATDLFKNIQNIYTVHHYGHPYCFFHLNT